MKKQFISLILSCSAPFLYLSAQNDMPAKSIFDLLYEQQKAKIYITTDLDSLINERRRTNYQTAIFQYKDNVGQKITRKLKIKPRGKYRRLICDFPTVKLNFSKKELQKIGLKKHDDYKLVTHCLDDKKESKENVLREYLVYKLYNLLSDTSFRVKYLNIVYIDSKNPKYKLERTGLLIEDTQELEERLSVEILSNPTLTIDRFNIEQYNFVALFQYMIGNVDWKATPFAKNVKIIKKQADHHHLIIPYDFDFSGLANVSYMRIAGHLNQQERRQRIFLGHISSQKDLEKTYAIFQEKKEELLHYIDDFKLLSKTSRKDIKEYIEAFYEDIADGEVAYFKQN